MLCSIGSDRHAYALSLIKLMHRVRTIPKLAPKLTRSYLMCAQECISLKANSSNSEVGAERAWPHAALASIRIA